MITKRKGINDPPIRLALKVIEFFYESCLGLGARGSSMLSGCPLIPDLTALGYLDRDLGDSRAAIIESTC